MFKGQQVVVPVALRSTPIGDGLPSPAVLLQGRNLPTNLHQMEHMLGPQHIDAEMVRKKLEERQSTAAYYHDAATSTFRRELHPDETVRMRQNGKWQSAIIRRHDQTPQSYWLETGSGSVLRRNRNLLETTLVTSAVSVRVPIPPNHRAVWSNQLTIRRVAQSDRKSRRCVVMNVQVCVRSISRTLCPARKLL